METQLTNKLIEPIVKNGLVEYSERILKQLIIEYWKKELENKKKEEIKFNKFNFIGKNIQIGSLERSLELKFSAEERHLAYTALDNLVKQNLMEYTADDEVEVTKKGIKEINNHYNNS